MTAAGAWVDAGLVGATTDTDVDDRVAEATATVGVAALVELIGIRPAWHSLAACRGRGYDLWFPERGADPRPAKAICETCPVADRCADVGLDERHGIWAGTSERQRRRLRRSEVEERPTS